MNINVKAVRNIIMGKYSSDSESSDYSKKKQSSRRNRSSSESSSSSRYSSRSKKSKKSKKCRRSRSSERSSKHRRRSRDRHSGSRSGKSSKRSKHSRRRSRSSSRSKDSSRSHSKDKRSQSHTRRRSRSRSFSGRKRSPNLFDGAELLAKLNKAATEAMAENSKKLENLFSDNPESRNKAINEINAPHFVQKAFCSDDRKDDGPVLTDVTSFVNFTNMKEEPGSLLHPNLLIENQVEKTNRWIKKLYLIRQKSLYGDPLPVE